MSLIYRALVLLILVFVVHVSLAASRVERIEWKKVPVKLTLKVGSERLVYFPEDVRVGVPPALQSRLRVQSVDGVAYLLAHEPFEPQRIQVRELTRGATYLFDIAAREKGFSHPVEILNPDPHGEADGDVTNAGVKRPIAYDYVALTRFAAQQMYAPKRLLQDLPGIHRVPLPEEVVTLVRGGTIEATPMAAWRSENGLYVTVVKIVNQSPHPVVTDPRDLRGRWLTATFQHGRLFPAGDEADTSCVYLISARPFHESIQG